MEAKIVPVVENALTSEKKSDEKLAAETGETKRNAPNQLLRGITMKNLLDAGLIRPGQQVLSCQYKERTFKASLLADGTILYRGKKYSSPSSWAV